MKQTRCFHRKKLSLRTLPILASLALSTYGTTPIALSQTAVYSLSAHFQSASITQSSFDILDESRTVAFEGLDHLNITKNIQYEIAKRTAALADGTLRTEYEGLVVNPGSEDLQSGIRIHYEGAYVYTEETKPGQESEGKGKRTLKIVLTDSESDDALTSRRKGFRLTHQFEYVIRNGREFLINRTRNFCQTNQLFWDDAPLFYLTGAYPGEKHIKSIHAFIENKVETYHPYGTYKTIAQDVQKRNTSFYPNGDIQTDETENVFTVSEQETPPALLREISATTYNRTTRYLDGDTPERVKVFYQVHNPLKKRRLLASFWWNKEGILQSARAEEYNGHAGMISGKLWNRDRNAETAEWNKNNIYLSDRGLIRLMTLIRHWEHVFAQNGSSLSPFALPFPTA